MKAQAENDEDAESTVVRPPDDAEEQESISDPAWYIEFGRFLLEQKKWWLVPLLLACLLLGFLVALGGTGVAPFIYTLH